MLSLLIGISNLSDVNDVSALLSLAGASASVGIGLWLVILGSVASLLTMFVLAKKEDGSPWWVASEGPTRAEEPPYSQEM